ncbi:mannosyltransferase family protein [Dactylosporangium sp. CA-092794]|uniref:mannosyltransferase family protein n=1 Tax=Dactylosporangium sp. CA-092794 TaxID=3239929 RepID=UPI003D91A451
MTDRTSDDLVEAAGTTGTSETTKTADAPARTPKWRAWVRPWMTPWLRSLKVAGTVWIAAGMAYAIATALVFRFEPGRPPPHIHTLIGFWNRFDTIFYVRIAQDGYLYGKFAPAFYPLYPFLIKIGNPIIPGSGLIAALVISVFFAFTALLLLHRLVDEEFGDAIAGRTVFYLAAFPAGFFLFAAYNESLYITMALLSLYAARKGNFWIASAAAALAGSTRLFGLLLAAPLAYEYMRQRGWNLRKIRWDVASFLFIPSGLVAFSIFLKIKTNDWLAFSHAQDGWKRTYGWPGEPIWKTLKLLNDKPFFQDWRLLGILEIISVVGAILMLVLAFRGRFKFRRDQYYLLVYAAVPIFLFTCTMGGWPNYLISAPRIALEWFPAFIVVGMLGASRTFERLYLFIAIMTQAMMLGPVLLGTQFVA